MVRTLEVKPFEGNKVLCKFAGVHSDTKPKANLVTGSTFFEVDTGDNYAFDETSTGTWTKVQGGYVAPTT